MGNRVAGNGNGHGASAALLHRVSHIVNSGAELDEVLKELIGLAMRATECDACLVYLLDPSTGEMVLRASHLPHDAEIGAIRMKIGEGVTGWVAQHKSVVALSEKASTDARFKAFQALPEDAYEAFLSVPLTNRGELVGVINMHHRERRRHTPDEIALASFIGEQLGASIGRVRLEAQHRRAAKRMETLAAVAETIAGADYLERILQPISEMVAATFDAPVCSIMLVDEERRELVIRAARCSSPEYLHKMPVRIEDSLIGRVVREARPLIVSDVLAEKSYRYPELARKTGLVSLLSAPLMTREKVIGTINIYTRTRRAFSDEELGFVKVVAGQAAIAIENARLMAETLEMKVALETRKLVERAKGILQVKHQLTEQEAYLRLRNESRRLRRPMRELAEAIILAEDLSQRDSQTAP